MFNCSDYVGRNVQLDDSQWHGHIVGRHPEVLELLDEVRAIIEAPTLVALDLADAQRECFYRRGVVARKAHLYLKVCVDYGPDRAAAANGFIVTAFLAARVKRQEKLLWKT